MAEIKTKKNEASVNELIDSIADETKRKDCYAIMDMMQKTTKAEPKMWGTGIVGFGDHRYRSEATGREVDWFITGLSPRKQNISVYLMGGFNHFPGLMEKLGKHKTGKGCLYINKLEDVDKKVLKELIEKSTKLLLKKARPS